MKLRVCVSLLPRSENEALRLIQRANRKNPDFIELRTDKLEDVRILTRARKATSTPLVATDRSKRQLGLRMLTAAAKADFDYVDIDAANPNARELRKVIQYDGAKAIVSTHALRSLPSAGFLSQIIQRERRLRPDVSKIVTGARFASDNLTILDFVKRQSKSIDLVAFAAGDIGRLSRICSPVFGAFFTFAALAEGNETGPGQLTIDELRDAWRLLCK